LNRRTFVGKAVVGAVASVAGFAPAQEDPYDKFNREVWKRARAIAQREQRSIDYLAIDPPLEVADYRLVWLKLEGQAWPHTWNQKVEY
jgi:hypothetical protein